MTLDHWDGIARFAALDRARGGPGSHIRTFVRMNDGLSTVSQMIWASAMYVSVYNVGAAQQILDAFPTLDSVMGLAPSDLIPAFPKPLVLRTERRRPVGTPQRLATCLISAQRWAVQFAMAIHTHEVSYDEAWRSAGSVKYFGRYAQFKLMEALRLFGVFYEGPSKLYAKGAGGPRAGLALLFPEHAQEMLLGGDSPRVIDLAEALFAEGLARTNAHRGRVGAKYTPYEFQVSLCDYHACAEGRSYPGMPLDAEMEFLRNFSDSIRVRAYAARRDLFPTKCLGELNRWSGVRKELTTVYRDTGRFPGEAS